MREGDRACQLRVARARLASAFGRTHAVLTATGTAALEVALAPLMRGEDCEVIVPDEACHRVAASVLRAGAVPVFVAVDRSLVLSPEAAAAAVTPRTVAAIAVHQYGLPAPAAAVSSALPHTVALIEDVAQAWDARSAGQPVGGEGLAAVTSFGPTKPIAVGAGGALLSSSPDSAVLVCGVVEERFLPEPPLPAPFPIPLAGQLLDALDGADALVARRRKTVAAAAPELQRRGLIVRELARDDAATWQRLPVWAPDEAWRNRFLAACRRVGVPAQPPHEIPVSKLPMFKAARSEGDARLADRDRLVLLSTDLPDAADRIAAALETL